MEDMKKGRITPRWIDSLKENEIFVFGSNLAGIHWLTDKRTLRSLLML